MKPRAILLEMWYNLLDSSQSNEFQMLSKQNENACKSHLLQAYLYFYGQVGVQAYALKYYAKYKKMPLLEQVAEYKKAKRARYLA
jgi:hypothetical protein